ncbi:lytic transglycosylase domain-containing protein [Tropicimonas sp. IMCC6043]|uniref:lytic transglycosylase domain-containing protein n=1 Tax=Tropicimonas sp. IMCC6043 TaxID=2510645 RepID=UPI00101D6F0D|nr:lytic transglycosylase domain-containing protein [Tropicimonas sp. IMCC6043]RYH09722.1 lytic transglycosylase domain-containing protein [Tropicimonas sp. IMCC6043]
MRCGIGTRLAAALLAAGVAFGGATDSSAETSISSKARTKLFSSQTRVLDSRAASQYSSSTRLQPPSATSAVQLASVPGYRGRYSGPYLQVAKDAARRHGVPEDLYLRLVQQESNWHTGARSHKGAIGLAQLMPETAATLGVDPTNPNQNLDGGARYLKMMYNRYGNWRLALAAYNAGPAAVDKYGGVPPYRETKQYVRKIWGS